MFDGKKKAVTFSYDDGVTQDERLIEIFDRYGLKATFNINSGLLGTKKDITCHVNGAVTTHHRIAPERVEELYRGHEVAVHTLTHPHLYDMEEAELIRQVNEDQKRLEELSGQEVVGMAYPYGDCDERIVRILREHTKMRYARTVRCTGNFDLQNDLLAFEPTVYHCDMDHMFSLADEFIRLQPESPKLFYIWGHSYEFDFYEGMWERMEEFCKKISGHEDIFYGTNSAVLCGMDAAG